ncbi:hypothetical protein ACTGJ9_020900 [Bradyrhizobium sp. RDM12]
MFSLARVVAFRRLAWRLSKSASLPDRSETIFGNVDIEKIVHELKHNGLSVGLRLPVEIVTEIREFAESAACFANFDRQIEFRALERYEAERKLGRPILTGHFFERVANCRAVNVVQADPALLAVAKLYLGDAAHVTATRLWWSFPTNSPTDVELRLASQDRFHYDLDDWRLLKFFFYINRVDEFAGPHVYVRGSHRWHSIKHQLSLTVGQPDAEILKNYGAGAQQTILGPSGYGFVEDPFGFHTGARPISNARLVLEVTYGVSHQLHRRYFGEPVIAKSRPVIAAPLERKPA